MPIRLLIVDDSVFMRSLIRKLVESDPAIEVVDTARNGLDAIDKAKRWRPDVITLDIEMPDMNGLDALRVLMKEVPTPTVMLSSLTQAGADATVEALQFGAVDFVAKPSGAVSFDLYKIRDELIAKLKAAAMAPRPLPKSFGAFPPLPAAIRRRQTEVAEISQIVVVGASTGGPQALTVLLSQIPPTFCHPILIVQHMPPKFTASLAQRLDRLCGLDVSEAKDGETLQGGSVYIAPGDYHMNVVERQGTYRIALHQQSNGSRHRPSVDELFASATQLTKLRRHYVLLTGMGSDGAEQMAFARRNGAASTIAEAQESCVVYGMPRAAVERGAAELVVPLDRIPAKLLEVTESVRIRPFL